MDINNLDTHTTSAQTWIVVICRCCFIMHMHVFIISYVHLCQFVHVWVFCCGSVTQNSSCEKECIMVFCSEPCVIEFFLCFFFVWSGVGIKRSYVHMSTCKLYYWTYFESSICNYNIKFAANAYNILHKYVLCIKFY